MGSTGLDGFFSNQCRLFFQKATYHGCCWETFYPYHLTGKIQENAPLPTSTKLWSLSRRWFFFGMDEALNHPQKKERGNHEGSLGRWKAWCKCPEFQPQVLGYYRRFRRAFAAGPNRGAATGDAEARRSWATEREAKEETRPGGEKGRSEGNRVQGVCVCFGFFGLLVYLFLVVFFVFLFLVSGGDETGGLGVPFWSSFLKENQRGTPRLLLLSFFWVPILVCGWNLNRESSKSTHENVVP